MIVKLLFSIALGFTVFTYVGYPFLLWLLAKFRNQHIEKQGLADLPQVSVIIAARNEESRIVARLENLASQDYPSHLIEILVVSDGSVDATDRLVAEMAEKLTGRIRIILLRLPQSSGKPSALNLGVSHARGQILVFCDCRQWFAESTVRELVSNFSSPDIGCVSGELVFVESGRSTIEVEMGTYWRYEKMIRKLESVSGSVVGVTGAVYAMRAALWRQIPPETLLDDLYCPMSCFWQGYRVLFDGSARAYDLVSADVGAEWQRKVRTLAGNWQLFSLFPELSRLRNLPRWWRFYSHKVSRLVVIFLLPVVLVTSFLAAGIVFRAFFWGQLVWYIVLVCAALVPGLRRQKLIGLSYFFMVLNCAAAVGWWRWFRRDLANCWAVKEESDR